MKIKIMVSVLETKSKSNSTPRLEFSLCIFGRLVNLKILQISTEAKIVVKSRHPYIKQGEI